MATVMATLELQAPLTADRTLTLQLPATVQPGDKILVHVTDFSNSASRSPLKLPLHHVGPWPDDLSLRREDMYGDDGRALAR